MRYLFLDMDGTLTESRQEIKKENLEELARLNKKYKVFVVSGAELSRMLWQVPLKGVCYFAQNGNEVCDNEKILWTKELPNKTEILTHIDLLKKDYPNAEVEDRGSEIVVSFTGFNAPFEVKNAFDPDRKIRLEMLKKHPHPNAYVAGTSGIDFIPYTKGENIKEYMDLNGIRTSDCLYIGDALEKGMNDETVVGIIPTFAVKNPEETLKFMKQL